MNITSSNYSNCNIQTPNVFMFRQDVQPKKNDGYVYLNPSAMQSKFALDFKPLINKHANSCPKIQYVSPDPRLISASHGGQRLTLDNPPIDGKIYLEELSTNKSLDNYGKYYSTYSDINAGNITYYINNSMKDPLFKPIFSIPARLTGTLYKDPMGSFRIQYDRESLNYDPINSDNNYYNGGLSWLQDSQEYREDLISKQMNKRNEQQFEYRW